MTQDQGLLHGRTPQVDKAVLQTQFFVGKIGLRRKERRRLALVQDFHLTSLDVDFAGGELQILHVGGTGDDFAGHANHVFVSKRSCNRVHFRIRRTENDLRNSITVTQINEDQPAKVPIGINPSAQSD